MMSGNNKYTYLFYIGSTISLISTLLVWGNFVSTEIGFLILGISIGWITAVWYFKYLAIKEEKNSLTGKSKKILEDIKNSIPVKKS